jgi:plastocyanin
MTGRRRSADLRRRALALAVLTGMVLLLATGVSAASGRNVGVTEKNSRYQFVPSDISITVGQSVHWSNGSDAPHTVTSSGGGPLSGSLGIGGGYTAKFSRAGNFPYLCTIHPYMRGVVHVAAHVVRPPTVRPPTGLPPTDAIGSGPSSDAGGTGGATVAAITGIALASVGLLASFFRRRRVRRD